MARQSSGIGPAVLGSASGLAGLVIGLSVFITPFAVAGWIADRFTSSWWIRLPLTGGLLFVFMTFGMPLVGFVLRPPDGAPSEIAERDAELSRWPAWRRGWLARGLAVALLGYAMWRFPEIVNKYVAEGSQRLGGSEATLYAYLSAGEGFAAGALLPAAAFLVTSAFTRGVYREIVTLVFLGAWALSVVAGIISAKILNPEWSLYGIAVDITTFRTLWAGVIWGLAAWHLRAVYKRRRPAAPAIAA